ncbi:ABC transporter permease [Streptomyces sp. NPDC002276]
MTALHLAPTNLGERIATFVLGGNKALLFAIVFAITLTFSSPYFLTTTNIAGLLDQIVALTIVALAYTFVLGAGEIDLSIGGIVGLTGLVMAKLVTEGNVPVPLAIVIGILLGAACGAVNAWLISFFGLPPFIVTLATNAVFTGTIYIVSNLVPVTGLPDSFLSIAQTRFGSFTLPVLLLVPITAVLLLVARRSVFGQHVVALGGNPEAVRKAGISVTRLRFGIYALTGVCCAIAGLFLTARSASAQIAAGSDLLLLVIAAVVIGGTPLLGGKALVGGTVFGCLIIGMISNGLNLIGVNANYQIITQGILILLALLVDTQSTRVMTRMAKNAMIRAKEAGR